MAEPAVQREVVTYEAFGTAVRDLARTIAADGYDPDVILSIARGGPGLAMGSGHAPPVVVRAG